MQAVVLSCTASQQPFYTMPGAICTFMLMAEDISLAVWQWHSFSNILAKCKKNTLNCLYFTIEFDVLLV